MPYVFHCRLLANFYSKDHEDRGTLGPNGVISKLPMYQTFPSAMFFIALGTIVLGTTEGRSAYWKVAVLGTLTGWVWMTVRS